MEHVTNQKDISFHQKLRQKMDEFAHLIYALTKNFPKEELYGITSQLRRASVSVILNYIEGYARRRSTVYKNFLEISYGSLQESKYLLEFTMKEKYLTDNDYRLANSLADEIGAMVWTTLDGIQQHTN